MHMMIPVYISKKKVRKRNKRKYHSPVLQFSSCSRQNKRKTMEDTKYIAVTKDMFFFAIFDGHGGKDCSQYLHNNFYSLFKQNLKLYSSKSMPFILNKTITDMQNILCNVYQISSGSTVNIVIICYNINKTYVLNIGDCRTLIYYKNGFCEQITNDHTANIIDEQNIIKKNGGYVIKIDHVWRVNGVLAVTRAIGNFNLHNVISHHPDIFEIDMTQNEGIKYIFQTSDGIFERYTNDEVFDLLKKNIHRSVDFIVKKVIKGCLQSERCVDNITVTLMEFIG